MTSVIHAVRDARGTPAVRRLASFAACVALVVFAQAPAQAREPPDQHVNSIGMNLVLIRPGVFEMGSTDGPTDEQPVHTVRITKPFYLGATEVSQSQWEAVMRGNPSDFRGPNLPVESVTWAECLEFCRRLTQRDRQAGTLPPGAAYDLPTEAEWEYACRAGSDTRFCHGNNEDEIGDYAWYGANSPKNTRQVGLKKPNAWGLSDMHGNVWEWCRDWYDGTYYGRSPDTNPDGPDAPGAHAVARRSVRGGSWGYYAKFSRSASRVGYLPTSRSRHLGFRVCLRGM